MLQGEIFYIFNTEKETYGMCNQNQKREKEQQAESMGVQVFGKHVSPEKGQILLVITLIMCILPALLGIRLWTEIPETVQTGLIGIDGKDDSMPRGVLVFGVPGLMCLLNLIVHIQLMRNQKQMTLPSPSVRLFGRWGIPIISLVFCSMFILKSAGHAMTLSFITPCILGLALLLLGAYIVDCSRNCKFVLKFLFRKNSRVDERAIHRFSGTVWMAMGLLILAMTMLTTRVAGVPLRVL